MLGSHLAVDAFCCNQGKLEDAGLIASILGSFPTALGMVNIMPPYVFKYSGEVPDNWGVSGVILTDKGRICVHTFPEKRYLSLDIFSWGEFEVEYATNFWAKEFEATHCSRQLITRGQDPRTLVLVPKEPDRIDPP